MKSGSTLREEAIQEHLDAWEFEGHGALYVSMMRVGVYLNNASAMSAAHHSALCVALGIDAATAGGLQGFSDLAWAMQRDLPGFAAAVATLEAAKALITDEMIIESLVRRVLA